MQIELDPTRIGLRHQVDAALVDDAKTILQALLSSMLRAQLAPPGTYGRGSPRLT